MMSEAIDLSDLPLDEQFVINNGIHPLQLYEDMMCKEMYMKYYLEYGPYMLLLLLDDLQKYVRDVEDYGKCAKVRDKKFSLLKGLCTFEFTNFEQTGGDIKSIPPQTIVRYATGEEE